jgi:hypothetical protein
MDINHLTVEELKIVKDAINQKINQLGDNTSQEETLEEAAEQYAEIYRCPATNDNEYCRHDIISAINFGAKWQQERMYSKEEVIEFGEMIAWNMVGKTITESFIRTVSKELFEQFKKK